MVSLRPAASLMQVSVAKRCVTTGSPVRGDPLRLRYRVTGAVLCFVRVPPFLTNHQSLGSGKVGSRDWCGFSLGRLSHLPKRNFALTSVAHDPPWLNRLNEWVGGTVTVPAAERYALLVCAPLDRGHCRKSEISPPMVFPQPAERAMPVAGRSH